ncbi:DUF6630 family protein [Defluviitalea phaphyphila]|uniref:DUF6630 family protein n=1 Tax=Defluviitalea phaphyphila TaxID=1473580 RepID=UPI000730C2C0|nr:DUF6630 family protein [Defluviitalea phaphyphila]
MEVFDKFRKELEGDTQDKSLDSDTQDESVNVEKQYKQQYLEIARIVSFGNKDVMREVSDFISDPKHYFITHKEQYYEIGMEEFEDSNYMRWISLVSILEKNNYVCERLEWKNLKIQII